MTITEWGAGFAQTARGRVVNRLRTGPSTVEELAADLGLTPNGVRSHLAGLERDGWIIRAGQRRGGARAGKPAILYALAESADALLSTAYRPLLRALLATVHETEDPDRVTWLLRETGRRLADEVAKAGGLGGGAGSLGGRARRLLESLGAAVSVENGPAEAIVVRGAGCPVGDAVAAEPRVCVAMTALLEGVLGAEVRESCDRSGAPRCRFEIAARG